MIKINTINVIDVHDWNALVRRIYDKPYNLQQQDGCYNNGDLYDIEVDLNNKLDDVFEIDIPKEVNGDIQGVNFETWLKTDPLTHTPDWIQWRIDLFWERNFYPDINILAQDLCRKGHINEGSYSIKIWW
jgi:hypothetical protein